MARHHRRLLWKTDRRIRDARAVLGVERLDARLALAADVGHFADTGLATEPADVAALDDVGGQLTVPLVTSVKGPTGQAAGGVQGGYVITVSGSGFVDGSGTLLVNAVDFYTHAGTNVGGTGQITVVAGGTPTSAMITVTMPSLSPHALPVDTAVVVSVPNVPSSSQNISPSNRFTFVQQAQVTSLAYTDAQQRVRGSSQAQNGPLAGGGTLVINGTGFAAGSSVQFVDYGSPSKTFKVPKKKVTVNAGGTQVTLALPNVGQTWSADTTVAVNVVPPQNGVPSFGPSNAAGGFTNQFTFYEAAFTKIKIKLQPAVVQSGSIYFVAYSKQGDRTGTLQNYAPLIMKFTQSGAAGQNRGTWEPGSSMITGNPAVIDASKFQPLSFTKTKDANGHLTAVIHYENLLYSQGYSNVSAGAVLSLGKFPFIAAVNGLAGAPMISDNPGRTYGLTELNVSGLATTNYSAPSTVVDVSFVDQFGIPLQGRPSPAAAFPVTTIGVAGGTRQGAINQFANVLKRATAPAATAFAPLISATSTVQILSPKSYLTAVENQSGIKPTTSELTQGKLERPHPPSKNDSTGYFYWVTAVGDGGGETELFGTGQPPTSPNMSPLYNTIFQTLDPDSNSVLVTWGSFPAGVQSTALSYNVYRQQGYTQSKVAAQPIANSSVQKLTVPVTSLSYLDDGSGTWADVASNQLPSSNATYSLLSSYFDGGLKQFFDYYRKNEFVIHRDGITWRGHTKYAGVTGEELTYASTSKSGTSTLTWYGRGLVLQGDGDSSNQFVFLDPSSPDLIKNTWMQTTANLAFSAGYQIFSACGAAGDGGPADAKGIGKAQPWKDLQNSIATAFDRGLATNFAVAPDAWANPPQFVAAAAVSMKAGTWSSGRLVPHTWTVTGVCKGVETVYGVVTSLTPMSGRAVKLKWSTAPTGSQAYDSFNVYRAQGSPGQTLSWKQIATNVTFQTGAQTVAFLDTGIAGTLASPVTYFAPGTTSDLYAAFQHQIGVNGLAYGYAYDDQGAMSSTYTANGTSTLTGYLNMLRLTGFQWGNVGNAKFGTAASKVVGLASAPLPQQVVTSGVTALEVSLQTMARDSTTKAKFPAFGNNGWTVRVLSQPVGTNALPGLAVGTKVPVSFMNGQAVMSLKNTEPVAGNTYTLSFGLYDQNGKRVKNAQGPVTTTVTLMTY